MPEQRFYSPHDLVVGQQVALSSEEGRHLTKVMRGQVGDRVELVNGKGILAQARVVACAPEVRVEISKLFQEPPASLEIAIAQAIPRMNRLEYIVEKGTELGMTALLLFPGERSEKETLSPTQTRRLEALAVAAMKQSGRLYLPEIRLLPSLGSLALQEGDLAFYGDPKPDVLLFWEAWPQKLTARRILFFVGPEAGFSAREESWLKKQHVRGVSLHQHVLRTDTAPLVALSLISHKLAL